MSKYRFDLPQHRGGVFLTDGGMETTLIFHEGIELPHFASFVLLSTAEGRRKLEDYYIRYLDIARSAGTGFVLDTATWRANPDWAERLGYDAAALQAIKKCQRHSGGVGERASSMVRFEIESIIMKRPHGVGHRE